MAIVTLKSGAITSRDAIPKVLSNAAVQGGSLKAFAGTLEANSGDSIGSVYVMGSIPSNARVQALFLGCDAITSGAGDIGVYRTTADGGAVVNVSLFASAQSIAVALTATDITHESGNFPVEKYEMPLWQAAGLTADPCCNFDIALTLTAATTAAGTVSLKGTYAL